MRAASVCPYRVAWELCRECDLGYIGGTRGAGGAGATLLAAPDWVYCAVLRLGYRRTWHLSKKGDMTGS